jgi:outer membrane protein assembly factor BamB
MARKFFSAMALFLTIVIASAVSPVAASAHGRPSPASSLSGAATGQSVATGTAPAPDWPTYGFSNARSDYSSAGSVNASNAANLNLHWIHQTGGSISAQPVVDNSLGLVFWGSWDGNEHATNIATNAFVWFRYLGQTTATGCNPTTAGVASTATVGAIGSTPVVFVGGGDANFYALNATNGQIIWKTSLGASPSHFIWSSPALYNGSIYIGNASFGDCPLVQGQLVQMDATTGAIQHIFPVVPNGCTGGGVWGSPTVDEATGYVYFATGNPGSCTSPYAEAIVKVKASDISTAVDSWQVRGSDKADLDFGSTPTLFTATINGVAHQMVGVGNKDGVYYALDRNNLHAGTLWRANIAHSGDCPQCGGGTISPSAWDGSRLYIAGGQTSINGVTCAGSVSAVTPTGSFIWRHCLQSGPVLGAVSVSGSPGVVFVEQGTYVMGIRASDGATLFSYNDTLSGSTFWGAPSISNGYVFAGNQDGNLYAFRAFQMV